MSSEGREDVNDIWADANRATPPPAPQGDASNDHRPTVTPSLSDLDPFAPVNPFADQESASSSRNTTLGEMLGPSSTARLEVIPGGSDEEDHSSSESPSLTAAPTAESNEKAPPATPKKDVGLFGGMFRSSSAQGQQQPQQPSFSKSAEAGFSDPATTNEKPLSSTSGPSKGPATPQKESAHNPFASIASVFKSSSSRTGTPEPSTSAEPLPDVVFDFNKFLEQMRSRSADPIAKYLRSFLREFSRKPPVSKSDQARVINDFLDFIAGKMRNVDPWKAALAQADRERGEAEFDMAMEAMEKLVMNRLWHLTFTPATGSGASSTDDLERDQVLTQRIRLFAWVKPYHLDLPVSSPTRSIANLDEEMQPMSIQEAPSPDLPQSEADSRPDGQSAEDAEEAEKRRRLGEKRKKDRQAYGYLDFAQREMLKINHYKAPRDKMICIMNTCKVIFGLIRLLSAEEGADTFVPFLIYVVLKSNPSHLVSNVQYIQRFRNPEKLAGETGYYLSSLTGAISFIETLDASSLSSITQSEFEANVENAIQSLPRDEADDVPPPAAIPDRARPTSPDRRDRPSAGKSSGTPVDAIGGSSGDTDSAALIAQPHMSFPDATKQFFVRSSDSVERIVSKPLGAIGRIFEQLESLAGDNGDTIASGNLKPPPGYQQQQQHGRQPPDAVSDGNNGYHPAYLSEAALSGRLPIPPAQVSPPQTRRTRRGSSASSRRRPLPVRSFGSGDASAYTPDDTSASDAMLEIDRQHEQQRQANIETLRNMFPQIEDDETLEVVLLSQNNDLSHAIDALLEMS